MSDPVTNTQAPKNEPKETKQNAQQATTTTK